MILSCANLLSSFLATSFARLLFLNAVRGGDKGSGLEKRALLRWSGSLLLCRAGTADGPDTLLGVSAGGVSLVLFNKNELTSASSSSLSSESELVTAFNPSLTTRLLDVVELIGIEDAWELSGAVDSVDVEVNDAPPDVASATRVNCGGGMGGAAISSGESDFDFEDELSMPPKTTRRCGVTDASRKGESCVGVISVAPVTGLMFRGCDELRKLPGDAEADCGRRTRGLVLLRFSVLTSDKGLECGDFCRLVSAFGLLGVAVAVAC